MVGQDDIIQGKGKRLENFLGLLKDVLTATANYKEQLSLISALFNVWEENILSLSEDLHQDSGKQFVFCYDNVHLGALIYLFIHLFCSWYTWGTRAGIHSKCTQLNKIYNTSHERMHFQVNIRYFDFLCFLTFGFLSVNLVSVH